MVAIVSTTLDVRTVTPRERHPLIFGAFRSLAPGEAFLLVNDHDPRPLYYQFEAKLSQPFQWEYLERGTRPRDLEGAHRQGCVNIQKLSRRLQYIQLVLAGNYPVFRAERGILR